MKICPVCKKEFKTKNGLKQHMASSHGQRQQAAKQPRSKTVQYQPGPSGFGSMSMQSVGYNDATCRVNRIEFLMDAKAKGTSNIEVDGANLPVLSRLSKMFDRYQVIGIQVVYRGSVATTCDGTIYVAFDYDGKIEETKLDLTAILKFPGMSCPVWTGEKSFPLKFDRSVRYVKGNDLRDKLGTVMCVVNGNTTAGKTFGTIFVKYDIMLQSLSGE